SWTVIALSAPCRRTIETTCSSTVLTSALSSEKSRCRLNCSRSRTMSRARDASSWMRPNSSRIGSEGGIRSVRNDAKPSTVVSGLLISCAMLAASSPMAASFVDCTSWACVRLSSAICSFTPSNRREFSTASAPWSAMPSAGRAHHLSRRAAQHLAEVEGGADRLAHGHQRLGVTQAQLRLLVQPRVADADGGGGGQRLRERDVVRRELAALPRPAQEHADRHVVEHEGHAHERQEALRLRPRALAEARVDLEVGQLQRGEVLHDPADGTLA